MNFESSWSSLLFSMSRHRLTLTIVYVLAATLVCTNVALGEKKVEAQHREKRTVRSSQAAQNNDQLMNMLQEYDTNNGVDVNLLRYIPTTPSPEDVNCFVEVPVTRRVGGRCVMLGSSTWGCQAGIFLAFSSECQSEATQQPGTQSQGGNEDSATGTAQGSSQTRNPFRRRRRPTRR